MPDVVTFGETMILMNPVRPGPIKYVTNFKKQIGGAESNVSIGLARLGHSVGWFSRLGDDPHGHYIKSFVQGEDVDVSEVRFDPDAPTGLYFKERRKVGDNRVYYNRQGSAASRLSAADLPEDYIANAEILHVTGITPALSPTCRKAVFRAVEVARDNDVTVSFDPNLRLKLWDDRDELRAVMMELFEMADIVLPGIEEGRVVLDTDEPETIGERLLDRGVSAVAVKLGAGGALAVTPERREHIPGIEVGGVVDEIGAGDGFAAGFLAGTLRGEDPIAATRLGNAVGAFCTTVIGDVEGLPTNEELDVFLGDEEAVAR